MLLVNLKSCGPWDRSVDPAVHLKLNLSGKLDALFECFSYQAMAGDADGNNQPSSLSLFITRSSSNPP